MCLRSCLLIALAAAGCAKQAPQVRAPKPMFDLSRICDDPRYGSVCADTQAPATHVPSTPIRVDTNLSTPPAWSSALQS